MNNYHIYEAIGRGKHSVVYKGRKKKTIEYYAVKSVEKSQRSKVLRAGKILHKLDHPNILRFYNWYETSAHLWLILEYCVGGDLMNLLNQDKRLSEDSVHDLAFDLLTALQYLHSKGIIYCDLKPSNILFDENGCAKLCDFGLARYTTDISTDSLSPAKRGTPYYMAPELFQEGGVYSYASDLWALGCVLYESFSSKPPFEGKEFTELVKSIISDPIPPLSGNPSNSFSDLINALLQKDPLERIQWSELVRHNFWKRNLTPIQLPPQPAFDVMLQQKTPVKTVERELGGRKKDGSSTLRSKGSNTPLKNPPSRRALHSKPSEKANLLRMSKMAKLNLQRDNEKENYRRPLNVNPDNETEVKMENKDMELDFSEIQEDEASDDVDISAASNPEQSSSNSEQSPITEVSEPASSDSEKVSCPESNDSYVSTHTHQAESESSADDLSLVFWHSSDLSVRPIMPSRKLDKTSELVPALPFEAIPVSEYAKMPSEKVSLVNGQIVQCLNGNSQVSEKQNVIKYLEILSLNSEAANTIINGPVMPLLVKMLRLPKASPLRVQLVSAIGSLIRHSTSIPADVAASGIVSALTNGLRDKQDKVRRFSMAALGELLFYISTLNDQSKEASCWQVPSSVISMISSVLRRGEDDITQLYALRTIENVSTQGSEWASRFINQDTITNICYIYKAIGKQESTKFIAGSCLFRLARFNPQSISLIFDRLSFKEIASAVTKGSPRDQQISLNLLNTALVYSHLVPNITRLLISLAEEKSLAAGLVSLIEQGTEVLRGKTLIFVGLLCKNSLKWLPSFFCNGKFLPAIDRLAKDKDEFVQRCMEAFISLISSMVPDILENVSLDVSQMVNGRRGALTSLSSRGGSRNTSLIFLAVLHLLGSLSFKRQIISTKILIPLANLAKLMQSPFQGRDDFQMTLLRILELVTDEGSIIQTDTAIFLNRVLPSLLLLYKGNKDGDARFLCLKILFDAMVILLSEKPEMGEGIEALTKSTFLPMYPIMIEDDDPIPIYAQKLLVMLIEFKYVEISDVLEEKTVRQCFDFLLRDFSLANVNSVKLCLALASSPEMETRVLSNLKAVERIGDLVDLVNAKGMEELVGPTLALCKAFISHAVGRNQAQALSVDPGLLVNAGVDFFVGDTVKDIVDFSGKVGVFLELTEHGDEEITDMASECVVMLLRVIPKEGSIGVLSSLSRISRILDCPIEDHHKLLMARILYSLVFACRHYLSKGLILSMPKADIIKIEAIVSNLKNSSLDLVAAAASSLVQELQRLPRCI